MRPAVAPASSGLASSSRKANSSPPSRPTVSSARMTLDRRAPTSRSKSSPTPWPSVSLTSLKSSRSTNRTASPIPGLPRRTSAWESRSAKRTRFGNPVSGSCSAWCRSWSSRRLRSLMSTRMPCTIDARPSASREMTASSSMTHTTRPSRAMSRYSHRPSSPARSRSSDSARIIRSRSAGCMRLIHIVGSAVHSSALYPSSSAILALTKCHRPCSPASATYTTPGTRSTTDRYWASATVSSSERRCSRSRTRSRSIRSSVWRTTTATTTSASAVPIASRRPSLTMDGRVIRTTETPAVSSALASGMAPRSELATAAYRGRARPARPTNGRRRGRPPGRRPRRRRGTAAAPARLRPEAAARRSRSRPWRPRPPSPSPAR